MRRFLLFVIFIILLFVGWSFLSEKEHPLTDKTRAFIENGELQELVANFMNHVVLFFQQLEDTIDIPPEEDIVEKPKLLTPTEQTFSVHNIEIGFKKSAVEENLGAPKRISDNEYGLSWHTYHQNYQNFVQVMYNDHDQVVGLYTNQDIISSSKNIKMGSAKDLVRNELGEPITRIQKGFVFYQLQGESDYDLFRINDSYITIFYDIHENNTVTALQIIHEDIEEQKRDFYTEASDSLREGFELQMFDLTNATRVQHELKTLEWDERAQGTARKHSLDMAENAYFNHTNLAGESPFDRMLKDNITFSVAGENLAYGQLSSIFAHEGLMNSLGHRKNILQTDFHFLGVGVAFNKESHPYYTQNYFKR